jgi:hypothetical protein
MFEEAPEGVRERVRAIIRIQIVARNLPFRRVHAAQKAGNRAPKVFAAMQYDQISGPLLPKIRNSAQVKSSLLAAIALQEENV